MLVSIALVAVLCVVILVALLRPEPRKRYNEFRRPAAMASTSAVYGDTGAGGISSGDMDGSCGGDGDGGGGGGGDGGGGGC
jgi:hypothetical protein